MPNQPTFNFSKLAPLYSEAIKRNEPTLAFGVNNGVGRFVFMMFFAQEDGEDKEEYKEIDKYCRSLNIHWFASPWDLQSVDFMEIFNPKFYKIPSALLVHKELLHKVARLQKYTFISTGMSTIEEIQNAINIFYKNDCPFELMHCNSAYPAQDKDLNLFCIDTLRKTFNCKVGYSGHSAGIMDGVLAVCFGATSVEKHITVARIMYGSCRQWKSGGGYVPISPGPDVIPDGRGSS